MGNSGRIKGRVGPPDQGNVKFLLRLPIDDRRERKDADTILADRQHQGGIVKLADHIRVDSLGVEPAVERLPDGGVIRRQKHRRAVERFGKPAAELGRQLARRQE